MSRHSLAEPLALEVGALSRPQLVDALQRAGVQLNASAQTLLEERVFDHPAPSSVTLVERAVSDLGFTAGAALPAILDSVRDQGLQLCPVTTGPYLRLAWLTQPNAPDTILSNGRAPTGSLTIAAEPLRSDEDFPKGFYLRVIGDTPWLRGYHCDVTHSWSPEDRFVVALP